MLAVHFAGFPESLEALKCPKGPQTKHCPLEAPLHHSGGHVHLEVVAWLVVEKFVYQPANRTTMRCCVTLANADGSYRPVAHGKCSRSPPGK